MVLQNNLGDRKGDSRSAVEDMEYPANLAAMKKPWHLALVLSWRHVSGRLDLLESIRRQSSHYGLDLVTEVERHRGRKGAGSNSPPHPSLVLSPDALVQPRSADSKQTVVLEDMETDQPKSPERCAFDSCRAHQTRPQPSVEKQRLAGVCRQRGEYPRHSSSKVTLVQGWTQRLDLLHWDPRPL